MDRQRTCVTQNFAARYAAMTVQLWESEKVRVSVLTSEGTFSPVQPVHVPAAPRKVLPPSATLSVGVCRRVLAYSDTAFERYEIIDS